MSAIYVLEEVRAKSSILVVYRLLQRIARWVFIRITEQMLQDYVRIYI